MLARAASGCPDAADQPPEEHQIVGGSKAGITTPTDSLRLLHIHAQLQAYGADQPPVIHHQVVEGRDGGIATPAHLLEPAVCVYAQLQVLNNHPVIHLLSSGVRKENSD